MNSAEIQIEQILLRFTKIRTANSASDSMQELTRAIGPGFHPDTPFSDYVDLDGENLVSDSSQKLDELLLSLLEYLEAQGIDPYELCLPIQQERFRSLDSPLNH